MIKRLQSKGVLGVHCTPNEMGFICGLLFVSKNANVNHFNLLHPDTGDRYIVEPIASGHYSNYQLVIKK
jgi:hypothetical protein